MAQDSDKAPEEVAIGTKEEIEVSNTDDLKLVNDDEEEQQQEEEQDTEQQVPTPMRELQISLPFGMGTVRFNYIVTTVGCCILWGIAIWCIAEPDGALERMSIWRYLVSDAFCFLFVGTRIIFLFFAIYVAIKYGDIKLGSADSEPEFDDFSYYAMLFAAGVDNSIWYISAMEHFYHAASDHRYAASGYRTQDELAQYSLVQGISGWGVVGWTNYTPFAIAVGLAAHRYGMPLNLRSALYPILGDYSWGWIGDSIDSVVVVGTVVGICSTLALGITQLLEGLKRLGWVDSDTTQDEDTDISMIIVAVITLCATASVVVGLERGIRNLSNVALICGCLLLFWVLSLEKTNFLLNLIVQTIGSYIQYSLVEWTTYTGAFAQLEPGEGRAVDGKASSSWWMEEWTTFYMAWWSTWGAFVGLFIARVSKGRTIGKVVLYSVVAPITYVFIYVVVIGGASLRQDRQATELQLMGESLFNDTAHYLHPGSTLCYDVPADDIFSADGTAIFVNTVPGVTPVCNFDYNYPAASWFNVMESFSFPNDFDVGYGKFLTVWSIFTIAVYFITSSDSGSLIVDSIASNGREDHHHLQRIFWAFTEGAVCMGLISVGGSSFAALQATLVPLGLPMNILALYMMQTTLAYCDFAREHPDVYCITQAMQNERGGEFATPVYGGIFNVFEMIFSFGRVDPYLVSKGLAGPKMSHLTGFVKAAFLPMIPLYSVLSKMYPRRTFYTSILTALYTFCFLLWVALFATSADKEGIKIFAWTGFLLCGVILAMVKKNFRDAYGVHGATFGDLLSSVFLYPQVLVQLVEQCEIIGLPNDKSDDDVKETAIKDA